MLVFISYEMSHSLDVTGLWYYFLLIGSLASAVGIEIIGILGGHVLDTAWRLNDTLRAFLAMGLLVCYTAVAMYVLRQNSILVAIPIVAAVVYLLAALADGLETAENKIDEQAAVNRNYEIEKRRADDELARKMQIAELRLTAENQLQIQLAHEQAQTEIAIAAEKTKASIANAEARKARARADTISTELARSQHKPAQEQFECEDCGRSFATVQALNAHGRFCAERVASNGHL